MRVFTLQNRTSISLGILLLLFSWVAEAACTDYLKSFVKRAKALYSSQAAEDLSGTTQSFRRTTTGETVEFCLHERVGTGSRGAVYRIDPGPDGVSRVVKWKKGFVFP